MTLSFAPVSDDDWPAQIDDMRTGFAGQLNVYRQMAHHPELLRAWQGLRTHVVRHNALGQARAEIVILRLAHRLDCAYEWNQHVLRGLDAGLSRARIAAMRGALSGMIPEDALLAGAADALFDHAQLSAAQVTELERSVGRAGVLDLIATAGMYMTLGYLLKTTATPLDPDVSDGLEHRAPELRYQK